MEKEFIPYEQALAIKELGFDESCFRCKVIGQEHLDYTPTDYDDFPEQKEKEVLIPTFSQAFRFFREKYSLHGIIAPRFYNDGSLWYVTEEIDISKNDINTLNSHLFQGIFEMHKTHEEAEHECLKKLIEIVKSK